MAAVAAVPVAIATGSNPIGWAIAGGVAIGAGIAWVANEQKKRSEHPPAKRDHSNTRKGAYDKAKKAGNGKEPRGPEDHKNGHGPHYHPDKKGHEHDHYYFPKRFF